MIPAKAYELLMDKLEDAEFAAIVELRKHQLEIDVAWDELVEASEGITQHSTITSKNHAFR